LLLLSIYKRCHQAVKYGRQRNHMLQDLTGLKVKISMKASKAENRFETDFQQLKTGLPKQPVLLTSLRQISVCTPLQNHNVSLP